MADCPGVGKGIFKKIEAEKVRSVPKGDGGASPFGAWKPHLGVPRGPISAVPQNP